MNRSRLTAQRLVALFLLGCLLFNFPLLALFNRNSEVFGIPLLYAYIFGVWLALIALMAFVAERRQS
jgi:predicted permease